MQPLLKEVIFRGFVNITHATQNNLNIICVLEAKDRLWTKPELGESGILFEQTKSNN